MLRNPEKRADSANRRSNCRVVALNDRFPGLAEVDRVIPTMHERPRGFPLNSVTMRQLSAIRVTRDLLFPWNHSREMFDRAFHKLHRLAGIPRKQHFGLHQIRKTLATKLWGEAPQAAQYQMGHESISTTARHYVQGQSIVSTAVNSLQQPEAFMGTDSKS